MSQQITPSRFRKNFLVIGVVLLVLGFFFFYWASRVGWDYATTYNDSVNLAYSASDAYDFSQVGFPTWGYSYLYNVGGVLVMRPGDYITVSYQETTPINGTIRIVIWEQTNGSAVLAYPILSSSSSSLLTWTNYKPYDFISVTVELVAQNKQNVTVSTTTTLHHYETPQWVYFGIGVVLSSLAVIPIFKSKK